MKIICDKQKLVEIIDVIQKEIEDYMYLLDCVNIDALNDDTVIFSGRNLQEGIRIKAKFNVEEVGEIAVNCKDFGETIKKMPDGDLTITVNENNIINIKSEISEFNIQASEIDEEFMY